MFSVLISSGKQFDSEAGQSLLVAADQADISLPYSCRTGRCSTCKCKVVRGRTVALQSETGLSAEEAAEGWILSCVRAAESDLVLEVEDLGDVVLPHARTLPCRIHLIEKLAPDVLRVVLRLPPTANFTFVAGQYIDIIGPGGIRRSYSLARAPSSEPLLELHIRAVEGGQMSQYWFDQAKANDLLRLNGPLGTFFLRSVDGLDLIFLATGTGIAPVKSILESLPSLPDEQRPRSVTVIWGGRIRSDLYIDLPTTSANQRYIPVLSRAGVNEWPGATGYVQQALLDVHPDLSAAAVYACGSDDMIHSARAVLLPAGLPERRFFSDAFVCSSTNPTMQDSSR